MCVCVCEREKGGLGGGVNGFDGKDFFGSGCIVFVCDLVRVFQGRRWDKCELVGSRPSGIHGIHKNSVRESVRACLCACREACLSLPSDYRRPPNADPETEEGEKGGGRVRGFIRV